MNGNGGGCHVFLPPPTPHTVMYTTGNQGSHRRYIEVDGEGAGWVLNRMHHNPLSRLSNSLPLIFEDAHFCYYTNTFSTKSKLQGNETNIV